VASSSDFLRAVLREFPQLAELINADSGLIHPELAQFVAFTQEAIDRGDLKTVNRCFRLVADHFEKAEPDLRNAFHVTFLEELKFPQGRRVNAEVLLGGKLGTARRDVLAYLEQLLGKGASA
jgi:hypothetical protein